MQITDGMITMTMIAMMISTRRRVPVLDVVQIDGGVEVVVCHSPRISYSVMAMYGHELPGSDLITCLRDHNREDSNGRHHGLQKEDHLMYRDVIKYDNALL